MMDEYAGLSPVHRAMVQARTAHSDTTGITDGDPHFVIDTVSRKIINNSGKDTLVQYDHNSERLTFELPRYIEGHDMSNCNKVAISYLDVTAVGLYEVDDLAVKEADTETVAFTWLISSNVTQIVGKIAFAIEFECVQEGGEITYKWHTGVNEDIRVISTITNDATVAQENVDVLEKWKQELFSKKVPTKTSELENDSGFLATDGEISFGRKDGTFAGMQSVALGLDVEAFGDNSFAEGNNTVAYGDNSHAEGYQSQATGQNAHSEGENNIASGQGAHAEGGAGTTASNKYAHAEGYGTTASAQAAHSEGYNTYATGKYSHVEGYNSRATADMAHAENYGTEASGKNSHAEGLISIAKGNGSHVEGFGTVASGKYQHVQGKYNVEDAEGRYAHIVGGGSDAERRNIHTLDWEGNAEYAGDVTATVNGKKVSMSIIAGVLLQPGAAAHNAIYRGKYLGDTVTDKQAAAIADGRFEDLFIGDYWTMGSVNYRIADFDYWYRTGFPEASRVGKHHAVIVPDTAISTGQMNGSNTTSGGYRNSLMKSKMNDIISALPPEIRSRLLVHNALLDGAWTEISVDPMNEIMVYGCYILADNGNRQTSENRQLSLFRMSPQARYAGGNYWIRNYANATEFTLVSYYGDASKDAATSTYGIRPVFAICGE
ncbi:hypothetical protein [Hominisplanchenecus sp.]|uniref:hypothetical protein n=1 Tax=Hominisplanchenecus sp. TaxID=3038130 RepID=UPI0011CCC4CC